MGNVGYVFCLLAERDKQRLNQLDLCQWIFYGVRTRDIDAQYGDGKSIFLRRVGGLSRGYGVAELAAAIGAAVKRT